MTGVGGTPRNLQTLLRDINKRLVAQERRRVNGAAWDRISDKPTEFPPSPHTHTWGDIANPLVTLIGTIEAATLPGEFPQGISFGQAGSGFPESIGTVLNVRRNGYRQFQHFYNRNTTEAGLYIRTANGDSEWTPWVFMASKAYVDGKTWDWGTDITGKPSSFPPSAHTHSAADITSGTLPVARGGTGITSNPSLLVNLGSGSAAGVFQSTPRPGVTGVLGNGNLPERLREIGPDVSGTDLLALRYNGWARGSNMDNSPLGTGWWWIYNEVHSSAWRYVRIIGFTGPGMNTTWERQLQNGTWQPWRMTAGVIGWTALPLTGAWGTDQSGVPNVPSVSRHGQMVVYRGRLRDGAAGSRFVAAGGLPTWARPANEFRLPITNNSGIVESSSWINVYPDGGMASGGWTGITSTCSWPAAY